MARRFRPLPARYEIVRGYRRVSRRCARMNFVLARLLRRVAGLPQWTVPVLCETAVEFLWDSRHCARVAARRRSAPPMDDRGGSPPTRWSNGEMEWWST